MADKPVNKGLTVKKKEDLSKWYTEVIQKADLMDYTDVSGCIVFKPYSYAMWEVIQRYIDDEFKKIGIKNVYFPLFIPEKNFNKEKEHFKGFSPEVAWVTKAGNTDLQEKLAIRPTSETIMYPSFSKWISSWRDLPLRTNQWCNVVRWEFKNPVPFMRTREFLWNEGHTVFASKEEAESEKDQIIGIYLDVMKNIMAIYGSPGLKSDKEKFAGAVYTCSIESFLQTGKAIQGPDFHHDGQNFAKAYDIKFQDKDGKTQFAWQNTWGFTTRMLGVMFMMHGDDKGLIVPPFVAPTQLVIIPIFKEDNKDEVIKKAEEVKKKLSKFRVDVDIREEYTPGWKFNDWELKGVPLRLELGPKDIENDQVIFVRRDSGEKIPVKIPDVAKQAEIILKDIHNKLYEKSEKTFKDSVIEVSSFDELKEVIKNKKMALAPFCNNPDCEDLIKENTGGASTINIPFDKKVKKGAKCIYCEKEAKVIIYIAKNY